MKRLIWIVTLLITNIPLCFSQFEKGDVELSLIGTAGYQKETTPSYSNSESTGYIFINTCVGYYIINGLSIEPQLGLLAVEHISPAQSVLMNLSYTGRIQNSSIALFLRGGYGIANAISSPILAYTPIGPRGKWDVHILNVGAGVKYLLKENIAFRCEINYRTEKYPYEVYHYIYSGYSYSYITETIDRTISSYGIMFGFSVIL
jgi:hypothetical protein